MVHTSLDRRPVPSYWRANRVRFDRSRFPLIAADRYWLSEAGGADDGGRDGLLVDFMCREVRFARRRACGRLSAERLANGVENINETAGTLDFAQQRDL